MMPLELAMSNDLSRRQFYSRAQEVLAERDAYRDLCGQLLSSLKDMVGMDCPLIGSPSKEDLLDFWEHEKSQGRGIACEMLTALNAITKAEAIMGENSNG